MRYVDHVVLPRTEEELHRCAKEVELEMCPWRLLP